MALSPDHASPSTGAARSRRFTPLRTISALIIREMTTRYGNSPGGYIWAVAEPLGAVIMLSLGFSLIVKTPPVGNSFVLFFATGYMPFSLYMMTSNAIARSLSFSKPLLFYPTVSWIDALFARFILHSLTNSLVMCLLFTGIVLVTKTNSVLEIEPILLSSALALLLALAIGTLNCALIGMFPTWERIWTIATRPLFLASAIFFIFEDLPQKVQAILWWNPLIQIIGIMRTGFYPMYSASYVSHTYVTVLIMVIMLFGLLLMRKNYRAIISR